MGAMPEKKIGHFWGNSDVFWRVSEKPVHYPVAMVEMERIVAAIRDGTEPETVWLLEHPPIYTAGTSAKADDLLNPDRFPVYQAGRGGQYTYHGPGQRVAYLMLDLARRGKDVRHFVSQIERWIIETLRHLGVKGHTREGRTGIWAARPEKDRRRKTRLPRSAFACAAGSHFTASA